MQIRSGTSHLSCSVRHLAVGFLLVLWLGSFGCDKPAGSGSIDGIPLGARLGLHLTEIQQQSIQVTNEALVALPSLFDQGAPQLDSLRVYTAKASMDEQDVITFRIGYLPFVEEGEKGYLAIALGEDDAVYRTRLWGLADPNAAWENFWRQFEYRQPRKALAVANVASEAEVDAYWQTILADSTKEGALRRMAYQHPVQMRTNSFLIRRTMAETGQGAVPPPEWLEAFKMVFANLEGTSETLVPVIGQNAAAAYKSVAEKAREQIDALVQQAEAGDAGGLRDAIKDFRLETCGGCHFIESHTLGEGDLNNALFRHFQTYNVRNDLYRVGYDVWGVPGEGEKSQRLANRIKAMVLVLSNED